MFLILSAITLILYFATGGHFFLLAAVCFCVVGLIGGPK